MGHAAEDGDDEEDDVREDGGVHLLDDVEDAFGGALTVDDGSGVAHGGEDRVDDVVHGGDSEDFAECGHAAGGVVADDGEWGAEGFADEGDEGGEFGVEGGLDVRGETGGCRGCRRHLERIGARCRM